MDFFRFEMLDLRFQIRDFRFEILDLHGILKPFKQNDFNGISPVNLRAFIIENFKFKP